MSNFNGLARIYDALAFAVFGRVLHRAQVHGLLAVPTGAKVLILGGGTGQLLPDVLNRIQPRQVVYLEASIRMLHLARRRLRTHPLADRVRFRHGTEADLLPNEQFDVVVLPFVLDLFTTETLRQSLLPRVLVALRPGGWLLVTEFEPGRTWGQRILLWLMYRFFRLTAHIEARRLPDWVGALTDVGLHQEQRMPFRQGFISTSCWIKPLPNQ